MQYSEAIKLMKELNTPYVKIISSDNKRVYDCMDELSAENTIAKLNAFLPTLKSYGRVTFIALTESMKKSNGKDSYQWPVTFDGVSDSNVSGNQNNASNPFPMIKHGYVSQREADLMASLEKLTLTIEMDKKFAELEKKISGADSGESKIEKIISKYLPILGAFVTIDDAKIANMMKIAQIQGMQTTQQAGIAGMNLQQNPKPQIQGTAEEQKLVAEVIAEMDKLEKKVSVDKILQLLKGLNEKPEFAEQAINFMNMNKTQS